MDAATQLALQQLDAALQTFDEAEGRSGIMHSQRAITRMQSVIERLTLPNSPYRRDMKTDNQYQLAGVVQALRDDYAAGYTQSYRQMVNADLFSDFLDMATYLLQEELLKGPAAVVAGGVLEEHVRKLCHQSNVSTVSADQRAKKVDLMNADLVKQDVYGKNDQKQITAWCGIRNSAAHAKYDEFDEEQVRLMIEGIRSFISRFPA